MSSTQLLQNPLAISGEVPFCCDKMCQALLAHFLTPTWNQTFLQGELGLSMGSSAWRPQSGCLVSITRC